MSKTNEVNETATIEAEVQTIEFNIDDTLNEHEVKQASGTRKSLTLHLYTKLKKAPNMMLSIQQLTLLARAYQFSKPNNLTKFKTYNDNVVPKAYSELSAIGTKLANSDTALFEQFKKVIEAIKKRAFDALDKALISTESKTTNVPYNSADYEMTTKFDEVAQTITLVKR